MIPLTIMISVVVAGLTACLIAGVPIVNILAAFGLVGSVGAVIGNVINHIKLAKVESNTNGNLLVKDEWIREQTRETARIMSGLLEYAKASAPVTVTEAHLVSNSDTKEE